MTNAVIDLTGKRIWLAGHTGLVGSALQQRLNALNCTLLTRTHAELDLTRQAEVEAFYQQEKPDIVILTAALVGGIEANRTRPAEFAYQNTMIASNVIHGAAQFEVERLLALGSSCFYPTEAVQPLAETSLLQGALEPTNEAYALAKIMTVKLCQYYHQQSGCDFISAVPTNLYGPGCHFDEKNSHVIAALIRKFDQAVTEQLSEVIVWGSGKPEREFLYIDDAADGLMYLLQHHSGSEPINVSGGETVSIATLAEQIGQLMGYQGRIVYDTSKPDGMMKKSLDNQRIAAYGWQPETSLVVGLTRTIEYYQQQVKSAS